MYLVPRQEWHKDEAQNGKGGNADQNQGGELFKKNSDMNLSAVFTNLNWSRVCLGRGLNQKVLNGVLSYIF